VGADEGFELGVLVVGGFAGGFFYLVEEGAHVGGGAHHLVDGGEIGPAAEAEEVGHLLTEGEEIEQDLLVGGIAAVVVGEVHAAAERGRDGVAHDGRHLGWVCGEGDGFGGGEGAVGGRGDAVTSEVVGGKAEEVVGVVDGDLADVVLHGAGEGHGELGHALGEGSDFVAGGFVAIDTGETVAEEGALEVVLRGGVFGGGVDGGEGFVDFLVEGESYAFGADCLREILDGVANF